MQSDGQRIRRQKQLRVEKLLPVQSPLNVLQVDLHHRLVPRQSRRRRLVILLQHRVNPRLGRGQQVRRALAHPQRQQGFQRPAAVHDDPQVRILPGLDSPDEILRQVQHRCHLPGLQRLQGLRPVHGLEPAVLADVRHAADGPLQLPGQFIPLGCGHRQSDTGKGHPLGQRRLCRPPRQQGKGHTKHGEPCQQPQLPAEPAEGKSC